MKVANNQIHDSESTVDIPAYELVALTLFSIANNPDSSVKGSFARANRARKILMSRLSGLRRAGTAPVRNEKIEIDFLDLTTHKPIATKKKG